MSVSPSATDHAAICSVLQERVLNVETDCGWMVYPIDSVESAAETLTREEVPIIIAEADLLPGMWQMILERISVLPDPPLLIVTSRLADERLWAEALNLGAWDVLAKPFNTEEVTRAVASAWRHWQERRGVTT